MSECIFCVHPGMLGFPYECPVSAPGITVELFQGRDDVGTHGVQMDIADKSQKIIVFVAENRLVPVFKEMAGAAVFAVKVVGVPGKEFAHYGGYALFAALEQNMHMIVHKDPSVNSAFAIAYGQAKPFEKSDFIFVVPEDICFIDPAHHDVVRGAGDI